MKRAWVLGLLAAVAAGGARGQTNAPIGFAVLNRNVSIADAGGPSLPVQERGASLVCTGVGKGGYHVICRDANGAMRFGLLPFRDEWGRVIARAWVHDGAMEPATVRMEIASAPRVAGLPLFRGEKYPILSFDDATYTVRYERGKMTLNIHLLKTDANFELAPEPPPRDLPESELERLLAATESERSALDAKAKEADQRAVLVATLVAKIEGTRAENRELAQRAIASEGLWRTLVARTEDESVRQEMLDPRLNDALQQKAELTARQLTSEMDTSAVREVQRKRREAQADVQKLRVKLDLAAAELQALLSASSDTSRAKDREELGLVLSEAVRDQSMKVAAVRSEEPRRDLVSQLVQQIEEVRAESQKLDEQLQALATEMEDLRKRLTPEAAPPAAGGATGAGGMPPEVN